MLSARGFLFYWDLASANPFAGGDPLVVGDLFPTLELAWSRGVRVTGLLARESEPGAIGASVVPDGPTHTAALLRRPV